MPNWKAAFTCGSSSSLVAHGIARCPVPPAHNVRFPRVERQQAHSIHLLYDPYTNVRPLDVFPAYQ